jgi:hypothetical protein
VKKLILILSLIFTSFVSIAQTPDTLQLSPKELFGESDDWNNLGILESYIDFSKDVLSSSNLSVGIIGKQISTTLNLGYSKTSKNGQWGHSFASSINPVWKYYGIGYGFSRNTDKRTTTLQTYISTDFDFQKDISISFIDVFKTKKFGTFGYSLIASKTFWDSYEGKWQGQYVIDENGIPSFLYKTYGIAVNDQLRVLEMGRGISRKITISDQVNDLYFRLADAESIIQTADGMYLIDNQSYYLRLDDATGSKPIIRDQNGRKELIIPIVNSLSYSILF